MLIFALGSLPLLNMTDSRKYAAYADDTSRVGKLNNILTYGMN